MRHVGILAPWPGIEPAPPLHWKMKSEPLACQENAIIIAFQIYLMKAEMPAFRDILSKEQLWEEKWAGRTRGRYKEEKPTVMEIKVSLEAGAETLI